MVPSPPSTPSRSKMEEADMLKNSLPPHPTDDHNNEHNKDHDDQSWWRMATDMDCVKRVSLDATETWMTDDDDCDWSGEALLDQILVENGEHQNSTFLPPPPAFIHTTPSCQLDDDDEDGDATMLNHSDEYGKEFWSSLMDVGDVNIDDEAAANQSSSSPSNADSTTTASSLEELWNERRRKLAISMERSKQSRVWIEAHIQRRATLKRVLKDIEASSEQVNSLLRHEHTMLEQINEEDEEGASQKKKKQAV